MPFVLIKGTFHLMNRIQNAPKGFQPDGDSIQFKPRSLSNLDALKQVDQRYSPSSIGSVNLRFEGIDAPELHYKSTRQPVPEAEEARDRLTGFIDMNPVRYGSDGITVVPPVRDGQQGFILARQLDVHGRPVSFVFTSSAPERDGSLVRLEAPRLRRSLNYKLLLGGDVYPLFYDTLFSDLRAEFMAAATRAWNERRGVWGRDRLRKARIDSLEDAERKVLLFPKLFRRLADYFRDGHARLGGLPDWLEAKRENDEVWIRATMHRTHFDNVLDIDGDRIALTEKPWDLVFVSRK